MNYVDKSFVNSFNDRERWYVKVLRASDGMRYGASVMTLYISIGVLKVVCNNAISSLIQIRTFFSWKDRLM